MDRATQERSQVLVFVVKQNKHYFIGDKLSME